MQSQWRFVPQYGQIYEDNLWISHHRYYYSSADCAVTTPPPRQLAINVTCLHQRTGSTYSVIIKQGVTSSVTTWPLIKLRVKQIKLFVSVFFKDSKSKHVCFLHFLMYSGPDIAKFSRYLLECFVTYLLLSILRSVQDVLNVALHFEGSNYKQL